MEKPRKKFTRPNVAIKYKRLIKKIEENRGNVSAVLREEGYSPSTVKNPQRVTESKTFLEVLEASLPDSKLSRAHEELLDQKKIEYFSFPKQMEDDEIRDHVAAAGLRLIVIRVSDKAKLAFYSIPDAQAKSKALELAYKLKGRFTEEAKPPQGATNYNFIFSGDVQEKVKRIDTEIKSLLTKDDEDDQKN